MGRGLEEEEVGRGVGSSLGVFGSIRLVRVISSSSSSSSSTGGGGGIMADFP